MIKRREKVSVKAAAIILGSSAFDSMAVPGISPAKKLRKNAENVQAEIVPGEENETENGSDETIGEKAEKENTEASVNRAATPLPISSKAKQNAPQPRRRI